MGNARSSSPLATLAIALLTAGLITACGADTPDPRPSTSPGAGSAVSDGNNPADPSAAPPQAVPSFVPPTAGVLPPTVPPGGGGNPPGGNPPVKGEMVMTGQVAEGVESGCLLLSNAGKSYLLMGGDPAVVRAGAKLTVRGRIAEGVLSTCQQGTPFQVIEARPA